MVSRSAKPGSDIHISNLSPATWYHIKVLQCSQDCGHGRIFRSLVTTTCWALMLVRQRREIQLLLSLRFPLSPAMALGSQVIRPFGSIPRLCHREECEVLWKQPEQQARDQPGYLCPPLLQEARLHPLDVQPNIPGRQVLDENL